MSWRWVVADQTSFSDASCTVRPLRALSTRSENHKLSEGCRDWCHWVFFLLFLSFFVFWFFGWQQQFVSILSGESWSSNGPSSQSDCCWLTSTDHHVRQFLLHQAWLPIQNKNSWMCQLKSLFQLLLSSQRCVVPQRESHINPFSHIPGLHLEEAAKKKKIHSEFLRLEEIFRFLFHSLCNNSVFMYYPPLFDLLDQNTLLFSHLRLIWRRTLLIKLLTVWSKVLLRFLASFWRAHVKNSFYDFILVFFFIWRTQGVEILREQDNSKKLIMYIPTTWLQAVQLTDLSQHFKKETSLRRWIH